MCPFCRAVVPASGAFEFVLCPNCKKMAPLRGAERAPKGGAADKASTYFVPGASSIEAGAFLPPPPPHFVRRVARFATMVGAMLVAFMFAATFATLLAGAPRAVDYMLTNPQPIIPLFVAFPFPFLLVGLGGTAAVFFFALLAAAVTLSLFEFARKHGPEAWAKVNAALRGDGSPTLSDTNGLFAFARLYTASLVLVVAIDEGARAAGFAPAVPTELLTAPIEFQLVTLAHASVWEELVTRVLLLGLPLLLIHYAGRGRLERPAHRYFLGGGFALDGPAIAFLVFSSIVFGLAHLSGWDWWKVPEAFVVGLAFGVLFLRYGLFASISAHFLTDYFDLSAQITSGTSFPLFVDLAFFAMLVVGIVNAIRYVFVLLEIIKARAVPEYLGGPPARTKPPGRGKETPLSAGAEAPSPPQGRG